MERVKASPANSARFLLPEPIKNAESRIRRTAIAQGLIESTDDWRIAAQILFPNKNYGNSPGLRNIISGRNLLKPRRVFPVIPNFKTLNVQIWVLLLQAFQNGFDVRTVGTTFSVEIINARRNILSNCYPRPGQTKNE